MKSLKRISVKEETAVSHRSSQRPEYVFANPKGEAISFFGLLCSLFIIVLTVAACTVRPVVTDIPPDALSRIQQTNRVVCEYKGKVVVRYVYKEQDIRLKGYLDKQCNNDFTLTMLGPLGITLAKVDYKDGRITAVDGTGDVSLLAQYIMKQKNLESMVELIRYPYINVDDSFKISLKDGDYFLTKDKYEITAGTDYLIKTIKTPEGTYTYKYSGGQAEELEYVTPKQSVFIRLQ